MDSDDRGGRKRTCRKPGARRGSEKGKRGFLVSSLRRDWAGGPAFFEARQPSTHALCSTTATLQHCTLSAAAVHCRPLAGPLLCCCLGAAAPQLPFFLHGSSPRQQQQWGQKRAPRRKHTSSPEHMSSKFSPSFFLPPRIYIRDWRDCQIDSDDPGGWCISASVHPPLPPKTALKPQPHGKCIIPHCPPAAHRPLTHPHSLNFEHTPPTPPTPHVCAGAKMQDQSAARWLRLICAKPLRPPVLGWPLSDVNSESGPDEPAGGLDDSLVRWLLFGNCLTRPLCVFLPRAAGFGSYYVVIF